MRMHLMLLLLLPLAAATAHAEMYRWVDENGGVHYSDRVPPQYADKRREVINKRGQTVDVKSRELTSEERAEAERRKQAEIRARAETERRAQYDRSLTSTYNDVEQLDAAYKDRLAIIEGKIHATEKTRANIVDTLSKLEKRKGGDSEKGLDKRIAQTRQRLQEQDNLLEHLAADRQELEGRYHEDRQRYLELTADSE